MEQRRRYVVEQRAALSHRRIRRLRQSIWRAWRHLVCQSRRRAQIILKISNSTRVVLLAHGFNQLDRWCDWRHDVDHTAIRLVRIHELWQSRRGFSALRQHQHEAIRRQSVMAASAFSTHNTRQRERQIQRMRAVSLVLQRKTNSALYDRFFSRWVMYAKIQTHTKSMIKLARARSLKRIERSCFVKWKRHTRYSVTLRQKLHRCQQNWQLRRQKRVWNAWVNFTQHSRGVKHAVYDKLIICALRHSLQGAWGRWKAYTRHANDLMDAHRVAQWEHATAKRDKLIDTLEDKHERLLLRAAQLGQQNNALRRQLVSSAATRIDRVLELGRKIRVSIALKVWKHKLEQVRMLQSRLKALGSRYQRLALRRWQSTILHSRAAEEVKRVQLDMTEWAARIAHACSTQWLKRRAFMSWRAVGRAHREINRRLVVAQRRRDLKCIRTCWTSWKSMIDVRTRQHAAATASLVKKRLLAVLQAYWQWKSAHKRSRIAKLNAVHCLVLLRRVWQRQVTINAWNQWRNFAAEVEIALLRTRLVLTGLEYERAKVSHTWSQFLLRTFSHWKLYAHSRRERRDGHTHSFAVRSRLKLLHRLFRNWKRRTIWNQARSVPLCRMERHLRHHYRALTKFAFWVWFTRVQRLPSMATQLQAASKHFTPAADVPARIARAALTDLQLAERQLQRSKQRSAWRLVNATVRNARRRTLQTAFDRLAAVRSSRRLKHTASARAFVDKMTMALLRSGFQRWKDQYLALAIDEAKATQQELLRALRHVTSYRQTLDPYGKKKKQVRHRQKG